MAVMQASSVRCGNRMRRGARPARQDLELAAGHRQAHEPERAGPAHGALAVVDQDGGSSLIARLDRPGPSLAMARGSH